MATESAVRDEHHCECPLCREHPRGGPAAEHRAINRLLAFSNERVRRLLVGFLAEQIGRGGTSRLARITGLDRKTIAKGRRELHEHDISIMSETGSFSTRVRRPGAETCGDPAPGIVRALQELLRDDTAGDPISNLHWTHRSLRKL